MVLLLDMVEMCSDCSTAFGLPNGTGIPHQVVKLVHIIYEAIRFAVPLILVIVGMLDMAKAVTSKDEAEIKKAQTGLVKKAVTAVLVFLMFSLVALLFSVVSNGDSDKGDIWSCVSSLLNGKCDVIPEKN